MPLATSSLCLAHFGDSCYNMNLAMAKSLRMRRELNDDAAPLSYIINWREGSGQRVKPKTWRILAKSDAIWPSSPMVVPAVQPRSREKNKVQLPPSF